MGDPFPTLPAVGLPLEEFWAAVRGLQPEAFVARYPDPFLIELGSGTGMADPTNTGREPTIRPAERSDEDDDVPAHRRRILSVVKRRPGEKHKIAVGRSADNDVVLLSRDVSKLHAGFGYVHDAWMVADLGSRYGTRVNGRPLPPMNPIPIASGAQVAISSMRHLFVLPADFLETARGMLEAGRL